MLWSEVRIFGSNPWKEAEYLAVLQLQCNTKIGISCYLPSLIEKMHSRWRRRGIVSPSAFRIGYRQTCDDLIVRKWLVQTPNREIFDCRTGAVTRGEYYRNSHCIQLLSDA